MGLSLVGDLSAGSAASLHVPDARCDLIGARARGAHRCLVRPARPVRANSPVDAKSGRWKMSGLESLVTASVDAHCDTHHATAVDAVGRRLVDAEFSVTGWP